MLALSLLLFSVIFHTVLLSRYTMQNVNQQAKYLPIPSPPPENSDNLTIPHVAPSVSAPVANPEFEFVKIKVAGVTFKNEKGASRQTILRKINFHDSPFNEYVELELRPYDYEGSTAYGVYANNLQIGNIPADKVQFVSDNWERIDSISAINVYGGGRNAEGKTISYGCEITLKLRNK